MSFKYWLVLSCLFVSGALLFAFEPDLASSLPADLEAVGTRVLQGVAAALLVAPILAVSVNKYLTGRAIAVVKNTATEELRAVANKTGPHYLTYPLPAEVADELVYIKGIQAIRQPFSLTYRFSRTVDDDHRLIIEKQMRYTFRNYSPNPVAHEHKCENTDSIVTFMSGRGGALISAQRKCKEDPLIGNPSPRGYELDLKAERSMSQCVECEIAPLRQGGGVEFLSRYVNESAEYKDTDVIFLCDTCFMIEVLIAEKPCDLEVDVYFGHRNLGGDKPKTTEGGTQLHYLTGVLWTNSAIVIDWRPKADSKTRPIGAQAS